MGISSELSGMIELEREIQSVPTKTLRLAWRVCLNA